MTEAVMPHIRVDERGVAYVGDTRHKLKLLIRDKNLGMSAEEMHEAYPHLSLADIYAAFTYYYDHKDAIDAEMARDDAGTEEWLAQHEHVVTREELRNRLRAKGA